MTLRRVIEHIREQNWTAIWIDLVIVVVGVFIGIQVANWNDARATSRKAEVFSGRLKGDVLLEAWGYEALTEYYKDVAANADRALAAIEGQAPLSEEQFVIAAYRATQYKYNDRFRATYDEMVSTGTIGLIADQKLRETAILVFTSPLFDEISNDARTSAYREVFRRAVSKDVQRALQARCGDRFVANLDYEGIVKSLDYPCTLNLPAETVAAAAAALRANPEFVPTLQLRFADLETVLGNLQEYNPVLRDNLRGISGRKP